MSVLHSFKLQRVNTGKRIGMGKKRQTLEANQCERKRQVEWDQAFAWLRA
jgi:hypothetical protein